MFNPPQKAEFGKRDNARVSDAFNNLPAHWQNSIWLATKNRYRIRTIGKLTADFTPAAQLKHKELREYIAASTVVHVFDGWSYLGRAIHSLLVGDHDCARHLGYYAELRAAMAILATEGIGVFSQEHVVVASNGKCLQMPPYRKASEPTRPRGINTHAFVWEALTELMATNSSAAIVLGTPHVAGNTLSEWLGHFATVPALAAQLAEDWLRAWGLDIARLAKDRDARNLSSYRPTAFSTSRPLDAETSTRFVCQLWSLCEPTGDNAFAVLDRLLLRSTLQTAFRVAYGRTTKQAPKQFRQLLASMLTSLKPPTVGGTDWMMFLTDASLDDLNPLVQASASVEPDNAWHAAQVVSRAFLLLRVASGAGHRLLRQLPATEAQHLSFWTSEVGIDRALWPTGDQPISMLDLWTDVGDAISELNNNLNAGDSFNSLWKRFPLATSVLSSCERVCLWGLSL